jgi:hypothetical protein
MYSKGLGRMQTSLTVNRRKNSPPLYHAFPPGATGADKNFFFRQVFAILRE